MARLPFPSALAPARADRRLAVPSVASGARSLGWMSRGACRQADPELFFPTEAVTGPTGRQPGCATQQNEPSNTSQSGLNAH